MYTRKGRLYRVACPEAKVGYLAQGGWVKGFGFWFLHPMYCLLGRPTPVPITYRALSCTFALHPCGAGRVAPTPSFMLFYCLQELINNLPRGDALCLGMEVGNDPVLQDRMTEAADVFRVNGIAPLEEGPGLAP